MTETSDQRTMTSDVLSAKNYYGNVNPELLERIPLSAQRVLEIGCGQGRLGEAFKSRQPKVQYFGVELMPQEAKLAQGVLAGVLCADIEQNTSLPQEFFSKDFFYIKNHPFNQKPDGSFAGKPDPFYFENLKKYVNQKYPNKFTTFILIDDKQENSDGAGKAGFKTIHFKDSGMNVRTYVHNYCNIYFLTHQC